ncbi:hypothetical protein N0V90_011353 [Kalmusia sp. IMI 367209]|nr:hypothetical protein N0V90_011353 [Kalmusia sp. IMI 367209]
MVDPFGSVLSLPGLFLSCVQFFEMIQYGRNLESDRNLMVLRLHYIGVNLSRWGTSVGLVDDDTAVSYDDRIEDCRPLLENIKGRFEEAQRKSNLSKPKSTGKDILTNDEVQLSKDRLCQRMKFWMRKYATKYNAKYDNSVITIKWAIYERKVLDLLVSGLRSDVDDLTKLFPAELQVIPLRQLQQNDVIELEDESLPVMQTIVEDEEDDTMQEIVAAEIKHREKQGHVFDNFDIEGRADMKFRVGNSVARGATPIGPRSHYKNFKIRGSGTINIGDDYL